MRTGHQEHSSDGDAGETLTDSRDQTITLRHITAEQLRHLGARQVVYLKAGTCDGEQAFVVFGADGTPLVVVDNVDTAVEVVAQHGLHFVTLH
jgi:hypothetical protein